MENNILFCYWPTFDLFCALSDFEISAPLQKNMYWSQATALECAVYEPSPRVVAPLPAPVASVIQRGTWKTGSTSSTSSESETLLLNHIFFHNNGSNSWELRNFNRLNLHSEHSEPTQAGTQTEKIMCQKVSKS